MSSIQIQNKDLLSSARVGIEKVRQTLHRMIIGHEDAIDAAITALIAKEHMILIGPPGTAKSYLVLSLARLIQARHYVYLMTRFTNVDELFGPVDVVALAERSELKRRWSNIVDAEVIFLDEVFKASPAILNALLSLMQERQIYDPVTGQAIPVKLWSLFAASNETPMEEELQAIYDRFAIKIFVDLLDMKLLSKALEAKWLTPPPLEPLASMEDVKMLHEYAVSLLRREDVMKLYQVNVLPLVQMARSHGVYVSDRTAVEKLPLLFAAYLTLRGDVSESTANEAALKVIKYVARNREELVLIDKAIKEMLGELSKLLTKMEEAKKLYSLGELHSALNIFREVALFDISKLENKPWLVERAKSIIAEAQQYVITIQDLLAKIRSTPP